MPGFNNAFFNSALAKAVGKSSPDHVITAVSLHTAEPDPITGSNLVTGGGYANQTVTQASFADPADGILALEGDIEFDGPENGEVTHMGYWAGGTFMGGRPLTGHQTFNANGKYILRAPQTRIRFVNQTTE